MTELFIALQSVSMLEAVSVLFGLAYVILAARENIWCWPAALIGTGTAVILFWDVSLLMESALHVYYLGMAIYGWWHWGRGGPAHQPLEISRWGFKQHAVTLVLVALLTLTAGYLLSENTSAALPFADSFTTFSAVITTWMVARKILENWLYWIVIDSVSVWLYLERGLVLYAALYLLYTLIAIAGYRLWRQHYLSTADA